MQMLLGNALVTPSDGAGAGYAGVLLHIWKHAQDDLYIVRSDVPRAWR
jgi:hypothetical protein